MHYLKNLTNKFKFRVTNPCSLHYFTTQQAFQQSRKPEQAINNVTMIKNSSRAAFDLPFAPLTNDEQINHKNQIKLSEKFMNLLMIDGKKIKAYNIFYESLRFLEAKNYLNSKGDPKFQANALARTVIFEAVKNVKPSVEVRKVRKGGITYQVPALISKKRQETLAIRWIINAARNRKKNSKSSFAECLALELTEASKKLGKPRQKRDELHKLAESNRAYIRFRWW